MVLVQFAEIETTYVSNSKAFLNALTGKSYQFFLIDIMLNETLTGVYLMYMIKEANAWVIICSSLDSKEYYEEYKNLQYNKFYIKKPVDEFVFKTNIVSFIFNKNEEVEHAAETSFVMVKQGNYINKVFYKDIVFLETEDHATIIHTSDSKMTTYTPLKTFEDLPKDKSFERINQNTLVNMKMVNRINYKENLVEIADQRLSLSRSCRQDLFEKFGEI